MKIGILTGGGDVPPLNAIIYGALLQTEEKKDTLIGFMRGWKGVFSPTDYITITKSHVVPHVGGTILRSSRLNPNDKSIEEIKDNLEKLVDGLIVVGGDDTLSVGLRLCERMNVPIAFVTKTIDNDIGKNVVNLKEMTCYFNSGFPTATKEVQRATRRLFSTTYSHERIMFLETMGRTSGWLALSAYKASPDAILIPEVGLDYETFLNHLADLYNHWKGLIVVVSEGVRYKGSTDPISEDKSDVDAFGHAKLGRVTEILAKRVKKDLKIENCNYDDISYLYRSGNPIRLDRTLGIKLGIEAAEAIQKDLTGYVASIQHDMGVKLIRVNQAVDIQNGKILPRNVPSHFYDAESYSITEAGERYFEKIR